jgi:uncharacterized protein (TIGR02611 family)
VPWVRGARFARRIVLTVTGVVVLAVGVVLLAAPGPGFLVIALGFGILSVEYDWARRYFERARRKAADLAAAAAENVLSTAFTIVFAVGTVAAGIVWLVVDRLPASGPWTGGSLILSGLVILATILVSLWQASRAKAAGASIPAEEHPGGAEEQTLDAEQRAGDARISRPGGTR